MSTHLDFVIKHASRAYFVSMAVGGLFLLIISLDLLFKMNWGFKASDISSLIYILLAGTVLFGVIKIIFMIRLKIEDSRRN